MRYKFINIISIAILIQLAAYLVSCQGDHNETNDGQTDEDTLSSVPVLPNNFNMDSAYLYVQKQVDFGPRVPNTKSHVQCGFWLEKMLKQWCDTVYVQAFTATSYKGEKWNAKNFIGTFNPSAQNRLLLCAHWDTRPMADQDPEKPTTPADGASDGASGVGVLLEVARQLHAAKPSMGIDIIFFDVEDGGSNDSKSENSWCLGSQYWAKNFHVPDYKARNGILLDMVGGKNALFARERMSDIFDNHFLSKVWQTGAALGHGNHFINFSREGITDDHVYVSYDGKIPTIDIIEYDSKTKTGFAPYWHTHADNMSAIDKNTLNAVGRTVLQVVRNMDAGILQ